MFNVERLQQWLETNELNGIIVPSWDDFLNEYVPESNQRLRWVSHFTGSVGLAIVLQESAGLFVDGRYTTQARRLVPPDKFEVLDATDDAMGNWLAARLCPGDRIGFDPRLHPFGDLEVLRAFMQRQEAELCESYENPIDSLWTDRPPPPKKFVVPYPIELAGESSRSKREGLSRQMAREGIDLYLVAAPDEVAWLLNCRGGDIANTPIPLSRALLHGSGEVTWFINADQLATSRKAFEQDGILVQSPQMLDAEVERLAHGQRVGVNLARTPYLWVNFIQSVAEAIDSNLVECAKSRKNATEISNARNIQHQDSLAVMRFLAWLEEILPNQDVTEKNAAEQITRFRQVSREFVCNSFAPISASGPNAALPHYAVSENTNRLLNHDSIFLIDSGGQYLGGTTDITRTVALKEPDQQQKFAYTVVMKGHIALATARFPERTSGCQLDVLARQYLWASGLNYKHGTGHGVGSFLGVHEGPIAISQRLINAPLEAGMILSNEPGYYVEGEYGMRIENLVVTKQSRYQRFLEFETITHVPMEPRLVEFGLLSDGEREWLRNYHRAILEQFTEDLTAKEQDWLVRNTRAFLE